MAASSGPGCLLRAALVCFGLLFLPAAAWFAHRGITQYWLQVIVLAAVGVAFLRLGLSKNENSWVALLDDLATSRKK